METIENQFCVSVRSKRNKRRALLTDRDKKLVAAYREFIESRHAVYQLGWRDLNPPYQAGYVRLFVLTPEVKRSAKASFFQNLLNKINTKKYSNKKVFQVRRRRFGKKIYEPMPQTLQYVCQRDFFSNKFSHEERSYFKNNGATLIIDKFKKSSSMYSRNRGDLCFASSRTW